MATRIINRIDSATNWADVGRLATDFLKAGELGIDSTSKKLKYGTNGTLAGEQFITADLAVGETIDGSQIDNGTITSDKLASGVVGNGTITVAMGTPSASSFTVNQAGATTINVPNNTNQLTNGANFATTTEVATAISDNNTANPVNNGALTIQANGTTVTTFTANSATAQNVNLVAGANTVLSTSGNTITISSANHITDVFVTTETLNTTIGGTGTITLGDITFTTPEPENGDELVDGDGTNAVIQSIVGTGSSAVVTYITTSVVGTAAAWGNIAGTLSNQTDLQTALNTKVNIAQGSTMANMAVITDASGNIALSEFIGGGGASI